MRALLIVACRTVVDAIGKDHPSLLNRRILHTVASLHISLYPRLLRKPFRAPGQFTHQLEHHGIVLRTLHRETYTLTGILIALSSFHIPREEVIQELIHAAMQTHISAKILKHAEEPTMLFIALFTFPDTGDAEHGATL